MTTDDIVTMWYAARHEYGMNTPLEWHIGREAWIQIRQIKDGMGMYLWHPHFHNDPITLMGGAVRFTDGNEVRCVPQASWGKLIALAREARQHGDYQQCMEYYLEIMGVGSVEDMLSSTGPTVRLSAQCPACGDTLPTGAKFCIECGKKQAEEE